MKITIIGAGPGGYETAIAAAKAGIETVLVESGHVGGTCLNAGCIPTKALCRSARFAGELRDSAGLGIAVSGFHVDFSAVMARKNAIVEQLRTGVGTMLSAAGVTFVSGRAVLKDAHTVDVSGSLFNSDYIIIATGSSPAALAVPGADSEGVVDSTELLGMETLPARLCVIGAGVVGLEFASVFRSFGSEVSVVEYCREVLPRFDSDIAKRLRKSLASNGIAFFMQSQVTKIDALEDGTLRVCMSRKGAEEYVEADKVLVSVGRRPVCEGLGLENAGVEFTSKGIVTDESMRTNIPSVFAIGDVNGRQMLAHAAVFQGKKALQAIFAENGLSFDSETGNIDLSVMPSAVFTVPEAASVGLTEEECREKRIGYRCRKSFYRANGRALCENEPEGLCKILEGDDGRILGCHVLGAHADALVQEVSVLMSSGSGLGALRSAVHIHPSLSEILLSAAEA